VCFCVNIKIFHVNRRKQQDKSATNVPSIQFQNDDARIEGKYISKLDNISFVFLYMYYLSILQSGNEGLHKEVNGNVSLLKYTALFV